MYGIYKFTIRFNIKKVPCLSLSSFFPSPGVVAVKDSVPLSPLKPPATPADTEQQGTEGRNSALGNDLQPPRVSMETSNLRPQTPKAEDEVEEDDEASGPLTISELVYRSVEFYNKLFKAAIINIFVINVICNMFLW